jgi:AbrB family looped-hinge helix DNA binding protein
MPETRKEAADLQNATPGAGHGGARQSRRVRIDSAGRVVVPAGFRKALGIDSGQELLVSLDEGVLRLQTIDAALERVRLIARSRRKGRGGVVDQFIAERRAEAARE